MTLLLYVLPVSMSTVPLPVPMTTPADVCCAVCSQGGSCCCLATDTSCDLTFKAGLVLRPSPCSLPVVPIMPATTDAADHLLPAAAGPFEGPSREQLSFYRPAPLSSIALGPPDKIPII